MWNFLLASTIVWRDGQADLGVGSSACCNALHAGPNACLAEFHLERHNARLTMAISNYLSMETKMLCYTSVPTYILELGSTADSQCPLPIISFLGGT